MTVKFKHVQRANPSDRNAPKKFYPSIIATGRLTEIELTQMATSMCTLNSADLAAAFDVFVTIIPRELARGNIVELGKFGSFWLRTTSDGSDTAEEVTPAKITGVLPRFTPGKQFQKQLDQIEFVKVNPAPAPGPEDEPESA